MDEITLKQGIESGAYRKIGSEGRCDFYDIAGSLVIFSRVTEKVVYVGSMPEMKNGESA